MKHKTTTEKITQNTRQFAFDGLWIKLLINGVLSWNILLNNKNVKKKSY